ncbi:hypothetical protein NIES4071_38010 [Calothrix sp. NIES-4071]|nr:hypothetical protein NIES4071_38010 [Calothrix sp. NIES-4071]BAZ58118.1 hypothetical protein NIES4105_37940 [Calothrix sp. NIES-4105]
MIKLVVETKAKAGETAKQLMEQTKTQVTNAEAQEKILELIDKILVYKFPKLSRQELENMFSLDDLKKTRYFQDVMEEGGLRKARQYIVSVLQARFTNVPSGILEKLNSIEDSSVLDRLIIQAATVKNIAEFQQILK